jgi:hypothetical protein
MHSRLCDLARYGVCDSTDTPQDDALAPARGIALALIVAVPCWALLGMLAALAIRWLS